MKSRHDHNLEILTAHIAGAVPSEPLTTDQYVAAVSQYLARIRRQPPAASLRRV